MTAPSDHLTLTYSGQTIQQEPDLVILPEAPEYRGWLVVTTPTIPHHNLKMLESKKS